MLPSSVGASSRGPGGRILFESGAEKSAGGKPGPILVSHPIAVDLGRHRREGESSS